jgi:hypothetical protein
MDYQGSYLGAQLHQVDETLRDPPVAGLEGVGRDSCHSCRNLESLDHTQRRSVKIDEAGNAEGFCRVHRDSSGREWRVSQAAIRKLTDKLIHLLSFIGAAVFWLTMLFDLIITSPCRETPLNL